jgi:hypothetical protein
MTRKSKTGKSSDRTARRTRTQAQPLRPKKPDATEALLAASAQTLRLPIDPAWRAAVKLNLQLIFRYAALVEEFALPYETEPAPVFRA